MAEKFEYMSLIHERQVPIEEGYDIGDFLNPLGEVGWELISVLETRMVYENRWVHVFYLKRRSHQ